MNRFLTDEICQFGQRSLVTYPQFTDFALYSGVISFRSPQRLLYPATEKYRTSCFDNVNLFVQPSWVPFSFITLNSRK